MTDLISTNETWGVIRGKLNYALLGTASGAAGDGTTDDTAALIAAVAANNGILRLSPGTYKVTSQIACEGVIGSGDDCIVNCVGVGGFTIQGASAAHLENVMVKSLTIAGDNAVAAAGVFIRYADHVRIENVNVKNFGTDRDPNGDGIKARDCLDVTIDKCFVYGVGYMGVHIQDVSGFKVLNSLVDTTGRSGIFMTGTSPGGIVSGNHVYRAGTLQGDDGIVAFDTAAAMPASLVIAGNYVEDSGDHGIHIFYYAEGTDPGGEASGYLAIAISGNVCRQHGVDGGGAGIHLEHAKNVTVTCNTSEDNWFGIHSWCSVNVTINGNTCQNCDLHGIRTDGSSNVTIAGNTVDTTGVSGGHGIYVMNVAGEQAPFNVFTTARVLIQGNNVSRSTGEAIQINAAGATGAVINNMVDKAVSQIAGSMTVRDNELVI